MTNEQLKKIRAFCGQMVENNPPLSLRREAIDILDAALAAPEQEPVAWSHPDFDFAVMGKAPINPPIEQWTPLYRHPAPQSQPVTRVTGYYGGRCVIEPLDGKSVFPAGMAVYNKPVAAQPEQPMQWIDVSERVPDEAQIVLFVLRGKVVVGAWIAGIFWYDNAKQVATAWMPLPPPPEFGVGGYPVTAPVAAPQREWVGLTDEEMLPEIKKCANYYGYINKPMHLTAGAGFFGLARAIESALRAKNTGEQA